MAQQADALQERLSALLDGAGIYVAVAESLTGGELSARFASAPGAGDWFRGGIVAYASGVKHDLLDVPPGPVVSEASARAMAAGACHLLGADVGVAVTGVGGPDEQDGQRPGTVWLSLSHDGITVTSLRHFSGSPAEIIDRTCTAALEWVIDHCAVRANAG
jgi:nicotinamide-nucleotide amidase